MSVSICESNDLALVPVHVYLFKAEQQRVLLRGAECLYRYFNFRVNVAVPC